MLALAPLTPAKVRRKASARLGKRSEDKGVLNAKGRCVDRGADRPHLRWERTFAVITLPSNKRWLKSTTACPRLGPLLAMTGLAGSRSLIRTIPSHYPSAPMTMWPTSTRVNNPENDDPLLLDRTSDAFDVWAPLRSEGRA